MKKHKITKILNISILLIIILAILWIALGDKTISTISSISANVSNSNAENDEEVEAIMQVDACGDKVPVPEGYVGSSVEGENEIDTGYVIYEGTEEVTEANVDVARTTRNQYVWVPVTNTSAFYGTDSNGKKWGKLYTFSTSGTSNRNWTETTSGIMSISSSTGGREPDVLTYTSTVYDSDSYLKTYLSTIGVSSKHEFLMQLEKEFEAMVASVVKYGGFYIGRYETGDLNKDEAVVVQGNTNIASQTWYTMYQKCKTLSGDNENVVTGLIWGCQWDRTLIWLVESESKTYSEIVNSTDWGNHSNNTATGAGSRQATGYSETWKANNIYDLAGNVYEWTMEAYSAYLRVYRGGYYGYSGSSYPSSSRVSSSPTVSYTYLRLSCHTLHQVALRPGSDAA